MEGETVYGIENGLKFCKDRLNRDKRISRDGGLLSSFRRELPTSKVAGGISMVLNSPRPEGTPSFMLSHLTLRMQARMKQYAIRPVSLLSASGHCNMSREMISISFAFISSLAKGEFPLTNVKCAILDFVDDLAIRNVSDHIQYSNIEK